jgi:dihydrofolate reductase
LAETCSVRSGGDGPTIPERGGGAQSHRTTPVFVLTHNARPSITMDGGTTFYFVTDGIQAALKPATEAASRPGRR